jgi:plasmid replication initiation protein
MNNQQLVKSEHTLTVAEGEKLDYYKFQDQAILKVLKGDVIL